MRSFTGGASLQPLKPDAVLRKYPCDKLHPIAARAILLLNALPQHSHFRQVLLASLLRDLPGAEAAHIASVSETELKHAKSAFSEADFGGLTMSYAPGTEHERTPEIRIAAIEQFIREECPGKSGQSREHYYQRMTSQDLYARYREQDRQLQLEMLRLLHEQKTNDKAIPPLIDKIQLHEQQFGFLEFLHSDPDAERAFAGGHTPGPVQEVLDCLLDATVSPPPPVSRGTFEQIKAGLPLSVLHRYYGQFQCGTCAKGVAALAELPKLRAIVNPTKGQRDQAANAQEMANKYKWHLKVLESQPQAVHQVLASLTPTRAAALMDFGSYRTEPNVADKEKAPFSSLVLVVQTADGGRTYVDILVRDRESQSGDFFFVRAAFLHLLQQTDLFNRFNELVLISDTASKQFRSRYSFALFAELQRTFKKRITLLFRAERHGHSLCDSHAGLVSQTITRRLNELEDIRLKQPQAAAALLSPLSDADSLASLLKQNVFWC